MADRSPNFPSMNLGEAIDAVRLIYTREGRTAHPRLSAAKALGYGSINGRSLTKLGALRAYGLLEGRGDDVKVTPEAITLLNAPKSTDEYKQALIKAFHAPQAFGLLLDKGESSPETLRWHLVKAKFRDDSAERLVQVFLDSRALVNSSAEGYESIPADEPDDGYAEEAFEPQKPQLAAATTKAMPPTEDGLAMSAHERVLQAGMLSKAASYRLIVSGPVGVAEIDRLLKKLELDKEILADADTNDDPDDI